MCRTPAIASLPSSVWWIQPPLRQGRNRCDPRGGHLAPPAPLNWKEDKPLTPSRRDSYRRSPPAVAGGIQTAVSEGSDLDIEKVQGNGLARPVTGVEWAKWYRATMKERFPAVELGLELEPMTATIAKVKTVDDRKSLHFMLDGSGGMIHAVTLLSHDPLDFGALSTALSGLMLTMAES